MDCLGIWLASNIPWSFQNSGSWSDTSVIYFFFVFLSSIFRTIAKNMENSVIPGNIKKINPKFMHVSVKNSSIYDFFSFLSPHLLIFANHFSPNSSIEPLQISLSLLVNLIIPWGLHQDWLWHWMLMQLWNMYRIPKELLKFRWEVIWQKWKQDCVLGRVSLRMSMLSGCK